MCEYIQVDPKPHSLWQSPLKQLINKNPSNFKIIEILGMSFVFEETAYILKYYI